VSGDRRIEAYAKLLVEECLDVQPGWQVIVSGGVLGRPLIEEVCRQVALRGAYAIQRVSFTGTGLNLPWAQNAPDELLDEPAPIEVHPFHEADGWVGIEAPENTRELSALTAERLGRIQAALRPHIERAFTFELKWVGCQYPTAALAQDAGMSVTEFEDFLFGACLLDWAAEKERMSRYADRFDAAEQVRIVDGETDLTLSLAGRSGLVDAGGANMPGGEFFYSPVEDSASGTIAFTEFPAVYGGREVTGIRLRFEEGRVVDATAERNEDFLIETIDRQASRRARNWLQPSHHQPHEEHALRREDRRHDSPGARERAARRGRHQRQPDPLGHRQGSARRGRQDRARWRGRPGRRKLADLASPEGLERGPFATIAPRGESRAFPCPHRAQRARFL
jgi:aminopeptidase